MLICLGGQHGRRALRVSPAAGLPRSPPQPPRLSQASRGSVLQVGQASTSSESVRSRLRAPNFGQREPSFVSPATSDSTSDLMLAGESTPANLSRAFGCSEAHGPAPRLPQAPAVLSPLATLIELSLRSLGPLAPEPDSTRTSALPERNRSRSRSPGTTLSDRRTTCFAFSSNAVASPQDRQRRERISLAALRPRRDLCTSTCADKEPSSRLWVSRSLALEAESLPGWSSRRSASRSC